MATLASTGSSTSGNGNSSSSRHSSTINGPLNVDAPIPPRLRGSPLLAQATGASISTSTSRSTSSSSVPLVGNFMVGPTHAHSHHPLLMAKSKQSYGGSGGGNGSSGAFIISDGAPSQSLASVKANMGGLTGINPNSRTITGTGNGTGPWLDFAELSLPPSSQSSLRLLPPMNVNPSSQARISGSSSTSSLSSSSMVGTRS
jgi:hypothetical protein